MKKHLPSALFITALMFLIVSCTEDSSLQETTTSTNNTIDLTLALQTDWQMADEILVLINQHRDSIGQPEITIDREYASAHAVTHTNYMIGMNAINHDNFHVRSAGLIENGAIFVGENVAYGYSTATDVVDAWLNSPTHKQIIEGNYTHSGFGIIQNDEGQYFFTQLFYQMD
jgi:uncharacterized protein YkwD